MTGFGFSFSLVCGSINVQAFILYLAVQSLLCRVYVALLSQSYEQLGNDSQKCILKHYRVSVLLVSIIYGPNTGSADCDSKPIVSLCLLFQLHELAY